MTDSADSSGIGNMRPLNVTLSGTPGPDCAVGMPFEEDPRGLWRADHFGSPFSLAEVPTRKRLGFSGKKNTGERLLKERSELLAELQELLWAHVTAAPEAEQREIDKELAARAPRRSRAERRRRDQLFSPGVEKALEQVERGPRILLILQGMDAAGKGGMVKSVVSAMDPLGVDVAAFGKPTRDEARQHYLERIIAKLPTPGHVGVFDRSHYEDVLVPAVMGTHDETDLAARVEALQYFERELVRRGFVLLKVMLHISAEAQLDRLISRLDRENKHWKYHPSDAEARSQFELYQAIYSGLIEATDTEFAPWHVIGADRKWYARLAVQELLIAVLSDLNLRWPAASYDVAAERRRLLQA